MSRVDKVQVPIEDARGGRHGYVEIQVLSSSERSAAPPLLDRRNDPELEAGVAGVQLLEGCEYHYAIVLETVSPRSSVTTDRPEIFRPDPWPRLTGRIRPGLFTGTLPVGVFVDGRRIGGFELEVRSLKLDYLSHYRWMLRDLADTMAEVIMRSFAPAQNRFTFRTGVDAPTVYQRFAFLRSIVAGDAFEAAIAQILSSPHREWREEEEMRPIARPIPSGPHVARSLARSGPRLPWPGRSGVAVLQSLPARMPVRRTFETYDTLPNRFVKHVLMHWRAVVAGIADALAMAGNGAAADRGRREAAGVLERLDEVLSQPLFRQVGPLTQSPADNQVLEKRSGYRDIYKLYVQSELAAMLSWSGGEDVYSAGQKDVAVLYEYWVFMQLARMIFGMCHTPLPLEQLLEHGDTGLDLRLKRGRHRVLKGTVERLGRKLELELWYNRTFPPGREHGSWTRSLRPDCSLRIRVPGYHGDKDEVWLHFDAKYRIDSIRDLFADNVDDPNTSGAAGHARDPEAVWALDEPEPAAEVDATARPMPEDLLKMHAYRDAIRRSSGAYVIYPGDQEQVIYRYHEILPGLGAFALRPHRDGYAQGMAAIQRFVSAVLDHVATQFSQHERHRYWERAIFSEEAQSRRMLRAVSFLKRPPADTRMLLGYVRDEEHYRWIRRTGLYNMRADDRTGSVGLGSEQLAAEIVVLYGPSLRHASLWRVVGDPRVLTAQRMLELDYPNPRSAAYFCLPVEPIDDDLRGLGSLTSLSVETVKRAEAPASPEGAPVATTWARFVEMLEE